MVPFGVKKNTSPNILANNAPSQERYVGGAMQKFAHKPVLKQLKDTAHDNITARLTASVQLQFVYDFANMDTAFEKLAFINDAGRPPLKHLPDNVFLARYGVNRTLRFQPAVARERVPQDWWSVYG